MSIATIHELNIQNSKYKLKKSNVNNETAINEYQITNFQGTIIKISNEIYNDNI